MQKTGIGTPQLNNMKSHSASLKIKFKLDREVLALLLISMISLLYFAVVSVPVLSMIQASGFINAFVLFNNPEIISAVKTSLSTTALTLVLILVTGTPVVFFLTNKRKSASIRALEILVSIPTVLPPAVAGIGLLLAFGRNGYIGTILGKFNIEIVFTPAAVILAQFFVSSGFYIQVLKAGMDAVEPEIFEVSYIFGLSKVETFIRVIIPILKRYIITGLIISWTRALGEFGATIMFAGNVAGKTRTMPLEIYTLLQTDITSAAAVSMMLFAISFVMLFIVKTWVKE